MKRTLFTFLLASLMLFSNTVFAHYASITVDNYSPAPGEEIIISIGFGHKFPADGELRHAAYAKTNISIIDPDGKIKEIKIVPKEEKGNQPIKVKFNKKGLHTILLTQKNFSTKTTQGYKYQPRNELENVIHSRWSETISKAVVNVGNTGKNLRETKTADRFQVIPMENPSALKKGDFLPVKATLDGKPWKGKIYATYDGFTDMKDTFCYATTTGKDGIAKIKILEKGVWLIKTDYSYPYENKKQADEYSLKATLTFKN